MNNIIIDFTNIIENDRVISLSEKLYHKGETINYIRVEGNLEELSEDSLDQIKQIDDKARVYIVAHGIPGATTLMGIHYQELGDFLSKNIEDEKVRHSDSNLKISFITCYGAKGKNQGLESYAAFFHRYIGQNHKIYSNVVARDSLTWVDSEKYTASDLLYAFHKLGIINQQEDILRYQHPGSKISFQWDEKGNEWSIDSYIDKYFSHSKEIATLLDELMLNEALEDSQIRYIIRAKAFIVGLLSDKKNEHINNVKAIDKKLRGIKKIAEGLQNEEHEEVIHLISSNLSLSKNSIGLGSYAPFSNHVNIDSEPATKEKNVFERAESISNPLINLAAGLLNTEEGNHLYNALTELAKLLSDIALTKLKREYSDEMEINIAKIVEDHLLHLMDSQLSKVEKNEMIGLLVEEVINEVRQTMIISPRFDGAIEGIQAAERIGGLLGLKNIFNLINKRSEGRQQQYDGLLGRIHVFTEACRSYIERN